MDIYGVHAPHTLRITAVAEEKYAVLYCGDYISYIVDAYAYALFRRTGLISCTARTHEKATCLDTRHKKDDAWIPYHVLAIVC